MKNSHRLSLLRLPPPRSASSVVFFRSTSFDWVLRLLACRLSSLLVASPSLRLSRFHHHLWLLCIHCLPVSSPCFSRTVRGVRWHGGRREWRRLPESTRSARLHDSAENLCSEGNLCLRFDINRALVILMEEHFTMSRVGMTL